MTARDEMAELLTLNPSFTRVDKWYLNTIARLATHPETAPVVFAWLVEAGVLAPPDEPCDCTQAPLGWMDVPGLEAHYHAAMNHEKASES